MMYDGPELNLSQIGDHYISVTQAFVQKQAYQGCFTHYSGLPVSSILHAIEEEGGWFVEERGQVRGVALAPKFANSMALLPLPMLDARATHRGVQCLLQSVQFTSALHIVSPQHQLVGIAIDFPPDRLPSAQAIRDFGLCADMQHDSSETVVNISMGGLRRFVVVPDLFPSVAGEILKLLGLRVLPTKGSVGEARTYCPARYSPLREGYRWHLEQIAAGRLSVIGLPDIPDKRFG